MSDTGKEEREVKVWKNELDSELADYICDGSKRELRGRGRGLTWCDECVAICDKN